VVENIWDWWSGASRSTPFQQEGKWLNEKDAVSESYAKRREFL
jgi:hypothetical protein